MKPELIDDGDSWMLAEDIPDSDIFFFQIPFSCFTNDSSYNFIKNYTKVIASYERFHMLFYFGERNSFEVAESILKALLERDDFGDDLNDNIVSWSEKLIDFAKRVASLPLTEYSNGELWKVYEEHDTLHTKLYTYGWIPVSVDMFHNNLTTYLKGYLSSLNSNFEDVERAFVTLTAPTEASILNREQEEFFDIYRAHRGSLESSNSGLSETLGRALEHHAQTWGHLGYIYSGTVSPFGAEHYLKELYAAADSGVDAVHLKEKATRNQERIEHEQKELYAQLGVDEKHRGLFRTAARFALTKLVRRHAQLFDLYRMHKYLLAEISKRLDFSRYQVQFMLKDEVRAALLESVVDRDEYVERLKNCVYYTERGVEEVYVDAKAAELKRELELHVDEDLQELQGQCACPGSARGEVKVIIRAKDMNKMREGDILVSIATDPDIVPAMKKAAAIVTEQGGVTSHAAIVSRELGIPCVIGTKIATKVFKDGDMVEVDAVRGIVKKLV